MCGPSPSSNPNCTWGETHRLQCEARLVMRWDRITRLAYYADVKKKRGDAAAQKLIEETKQQWNATQQSLL